MIHKLKERKNLISALISTLVIISLICFLFYLIGHKVPYADGVLMDTGWQVQINDDHYQDVTLSDFAFQAVDKGDTILMTNTLSTKEVQDPLLRFLTYHCAVEVSIDNQSIYQYEGEPGHPNWMVGNGFHYVELPKDYMGKQLQISLQVTENEAFTSFDKVLILEGNHAVSDYIYEYRLALCISVFLIVFGCILILIATFAQFYDREFRWLFWISLFSIAIGVWISCNYQLMQVFSQNLWENSLIEYTALYFAPLPIMIFFFMIGNELYFEKLIFRILSICSALFFVTAELLHITNLIHLPAMLPVYLGLLVLYGPFIVVVAIKHLRDDKRTMRIISVGILILVAFVISDMMRFNIQKYIMPDFMRDMISLVPFGTLLFIIFLIISYCVSMVDNMYIKAEHKVLLKMAYSDELTNIHNRAKCEEVLQELEYGQQGYAILSLDLNNLKRINDTLGHACGDRLLKDFAAILAKTFMADGTVGRMGGDEFMVILPNISRARLQGRIDLMEEMMARQNIREKDIRLSVAWGYAFSTECAGGDSDAVYELADKRMYRMKRKMKDAGLIDARD